MTEGFWLSSANGAFLAEYALTRAGPGCGRRVADAVILPDEPHGRAIVRDYPSLTEAAFAPMRAVQA
jgi:hypothetical protein